MLRPTLALLLALTAAAPALGQARWTLVRDGAVVPGQETRGTTAHAIRAELEGGTRWLHGLGFRAPDVDAHTDAFTGASVRPTEDSAAVIEAFADGIATTGDRPLALLLDNKPSNHAEAVSQALGDTLLMRPRSYQPTDKPHVEGAFGLFRVEAPELSITACTPEQLALQIATLVVTTWARTTNHRPRPARGGKSRVQLYLENKPSEEQVAQAQKALRERLRQQRRAQQTRQRRQDPVTHAILDDAFLRLGLEDSERRLRIAIASWPLDDILAGIAIFEGKRTAGSPPTPSTPATSLASSATSPSNARAC